MYTRRSDCITVGVKKSLPFSLLTVTVSEGNLSPLVSRGDTGLHCPRRLVSFLNSDSCSRSADSGPAISKQHLGLSFLAARLLGSQQNS